MSRDWLEKFYCECGREVSLAYNVLNHTNTWGVTLVTAFLAAVVIKAIEYENGKIIFLYPTYVHWFMIIIAWIALLRFFARSALGLTNMYRWNELIYASSKVLSLSKDEPDCALFERNCAKKIEAYFYRFKSPKPMSEIIWQSLKLMYLWFFLLILILFIWGIISLERGPLYYLGIIFFCIVTAIEIYWLATWHGIQYEELKLEKEPEILSVWGLADTSSKARAESVSRASEENPDPHGPQ